MKCCPKCGCKEFYTNAHIVQGWLVDENGEYIATTEECVAVSHEPNDWDIWECKKCGYRDAGYIFTVDEE